MCAMRQAGSSECPPGLATGSSTGLAGWLAGQACRCCRWNDWNMWCGLLGKARCWGHMQCSVTQPPQQHALHMPPIVQFTHSAHSRIVIHPHFIPALDLPPHFNSAPSSIVIHPHVSYAIDPIVNQFVHSAPCHIVIHPQVLTQHIPPPPYNILAIVHPVTMSNTYSS